MSKLTLQYEGIALKDYAVGTGVTIGRLPDNAVVIDNPAVSGHHARVFQEGNSVILEDLRSTNGTFVNGRPITRHVLQHGDEVLVGKHQLMFDQNAAEAQPVAGAPMQGLGDTVYLDTKQHRALRATLESARADAAKPVHTRAAVSAPTAPRRVGVLRVIAGSAEQDEYSLDGHTSIIGRSNTALVRLRGLVQAVGRRRHREAWHWLRSHRDGRQAARQPVAARRPSQPAGRRHAHGERPGAGICLEGSRSR